MGILGARVARMCSVGRAEVELVSGFGAVQNTMCAYQISDFHNCRVAGVHHVDVAATRRLPIGVLECQVAINRVVLAARGDEGRHSIKE
jgi:hypothetical protein